MEQESFTQLAYRLWGEYLKWLKENERSGYKQLRLKQAMLFEELLKKIGGNENCVPSIDLDHIMKPLVEMEAKDVMMREGIYSFLDVIYEGYFLYNKNNFKRGRNPEGKE